MEYGAGFDMVPRLSMGIVDRGNWDRFIDIIKEHYKDDAKVEIKPNYIGFNAGEYPMLPIEGHKFLRFSSKVSGVDGLEVEQYIDDITRIAKAHFGSRIQYWHEATDRYGGYDWNQVHESINSYDKPDEVEIPASIVSALKNTDHLKELDAPLFELKEIPGKGKGLVARVRIPRGTRILREKPLLTVRFISREKSEPILVAKLKAMPKSSQRQFLTLHNNFPGKYPFSGIFKTNSLPCGGGSPVAGVYPTACFINHSCIANAHNCWNSAEEHETIHALRPIESGEEITITYKDKGPSSERQSSLKKDFGFTCTCETCSLPPSLLQASDNRRRQIQSLDDAIGDPFRMKNNPHDSLKDCYSLLNVLAEEFGDCAGAWIARVYYDAFQISIVHGDQTRASIFAERAHEARVICGGEDSPDTLEMKSLALKPGNHSTFGAYSTKWRMRRNLVPKGLDKVQFDKWLFRQGS